MHDDIQSSAFWTSSYYFAKAFILVLPEFGMMPQLCVISFVCCHVFTWENCAVVRTLPNEGTVCSERVRLHFVL